MPTYPRPLCPSACPCHPCLPPAAHAHASIRQHTPLSAHTNKLSVCLSLCSLVTLPRQQLAMQVQVPDCSPHSYALTLSPDETRPLSSASSHSPDPQPASASDDEPHTTHSPRSTSLHPSWRRPSSSSTDISLGTNFGGSTSSLTWTAISPGPNCASSSSAPVVERPWKK